MFNRSVLNRSIGSDFGCLIVRVAYCDGRSQWRTPRLVKVFNTVSPEMKAKRAKRASSVVMC